MNERGQAALDDCFLHDRDRLTHDEALALIAERITPVDGSERIPLLLAHGRVLAEPILAPHDVPAFTNAAVDGYAVSSSGLHDNAPTTLTVSKRIVAGRDAGHRLHSGEAARIFTGAPLPQGADTVVMQEDVTTDRKTVTVPAGVKPGANVRKAGEDRVAGSSVVEAGTRLRSQEIAAIASVGEAAIRCRKRLKVGLISTGDEIVRPGRELLPGHVFDSNHFLLRGLLDTVDAEVQDFGIVPDDRTRVRETLTMAAESSDVIISSGGASLGEGDHIVDTLRALGQIHGWQLAIKPGRPLALGAIGNATYLGLPGNPVAVFVCFLLYGQPLFARLQGQDWHPPQRYPLPAGFEITSKKPDRREFLRGWIDNSGDRPVVRKFERDGSGLITGLTQATGLIELAETVTSVKFGEPVSFIPFTEFGLIPR